MAEKPIIILANDNALSKDYWREELQKYLASRGCEVDIRQAVSVREIYRQIEKIAAEGKKPKLIITDKFLEGDEKWSGESQILKSEHASKRKDPTHMAVDIPFIVVSGAAGIEREFDFLSNASRLFVSSSVIHDLNSRTVSKPVTARMLKKFKQFLEEALALSLPPSTVNL